MLNFEYPVYLEEFLRLPKYCKIIKYRDFQYRLNLKKLVLNEDLFKWKMKDNNKYTLCALEIENPIHLFISCNQVKPIWDVIFQLCCENNIEIHKNICALMFSHLSEKSTHVINFVSVMAKQYIYHCRCNRKNINVVSFLNELVKMQDVEFAIAKRENRLTTHCKYWSPIFKFLNCTT